MSDRNAHRENLFLSHAVDLQKVCPSADRIFICPICFNVFSEQQLHNGDLTDGHVWAERFVREFTSSQRALHQRVLLCKDCNSRSGSASEAALIEFEEFRKTHEAGQFFRPSTRVFLIPGAEPADLGSIPIKFHDEKNFRVTFPTNKKGHPLYNPYEKVKFEQYFKQGKCTVIVEEKYQAREKWKYAQAALLTSAYLLSFYSFGYKYVFRSCLDPVRSYILESFERNVDERLDGGKEISVRMCSEHMNSEPEIDFFPIVNDDPHYLEVSFLDYHIRIPYPHPFVLNREIINSVRDLRTISIRVSDHRIHDGACIIDFLIGEPDYLVDG